MYETKGSGSKFLSKMVSGNNNMNHQHHRSYFNVIIMTVSLLITIDWYHYILMGGGGSFLLMLLIFSHVNALDNLQSYYQFQMALAFKPSSPSSSSSLPPPNSTVESAIADTSGLGSPNGRSMDIDDNTNDTAESSIDEGSQPTEQMAPNDEVQPRSAEELPPTSPQSSIPTFSMSSQEFPEAISTSSINSDDAQSETLLTEIYNYTIRSVVMVDAVITFPNGSSFGSQGSGFIYDNVGHVITNYHVIEGANNTAVSIKFIDGNSYPVTIVGGDRFSDLAVLKIDDPSVLTEEHALALPVADTSSLNIGQRVVAIGNPLGWSGTMTEGIISQLNRTLPVADFFQTGMVQFDAPITHGNSGGPLLNMQKEVVGITSGGIEGTGFISFSIPSDTVKRIVPSLIEDGTYAHPWLGISGIDVIPAIAQDLGLNEARGIIVTEVSPGSPAAAAGISAGTNPIGQLGYDIINSDADVILGLDSKDVRGIDDILNYIDTKAVGDTVAIKGVRDGHAGSVVATLTERPQ